MQNRTRRGAASGVRITKKLHASQFYRRSRRWVRTKKAGRGTGRKFTSKDLARPPSLPPSPVHRHSLDAVAGPLPRMAWHSKSGAPPKLFRTIIITCRGRRAIFYSISSAGRDGCSGRDGGSLWEKKKIDGDRGKISEDDREETQKNYPREKLAFPHYRKFNHSSLIAFGIAILIFNYLNCNCH